MELTDLIYGIIIFLAGHFWWKTMQAREHAEKLAIHACKRENVQLLDATVSLKKFGFKRSSKNGLYFVRYFNFEFTSDSSERRAGVIVMRDNHQEYLIMDLAESTTIDIDDNQT